ncbi:MAG: SAM-dependent methyltransferase, partial [Mycobacterium sp.]
PFARVFTDAAGAGLWSMYAAPVADLEPELRAWRQAMVDFMAVRTVFFDEVFLAAADAGVRQVVILAAGLDSRSWRLPWPDGVTVFELDQPKVLDFKTATLREHGARPAANLVNVPIDLRHDWPNALTQAGFDVSKPTAWSAEGLLRYLPASAQDSLIERIHALSPAGSWLVTNAPSGDYLDPERLARGRARAERLRAAAARLTAVEMPNLEDLWYAEERTDVGDWLRDHGWDVSVATMAEMLERHHRNIPEPDAMAPTIFVSARRTE